MKNEWKPLLSDGDMSTGGRATTMRYTPFGLVPFDGRGPMSPEDVRDHYENLRQSGALRDGVPFVAVQANALRVLREGGRQYMLNMGDKITMLLFDSKGKRHDIHVRMDGFPMPELRAIEECVVRKSSDPDWSFMDVTGCNGRGPITDEVFCPYCGGRLRRG